MQHHGDGFGERGDLRVEPCGRAEEAMRGNNHVLGHPAAFVEPEQTQLRADGVAPREARRALATRPERLDHNGFARSETRNPGTPAVHDSRDFMPWS